MGEVTVGTIVLPTAPLGPVSPLPILEPLASIKEIAPEVPADIAARARAGAPPSLLPYQAQDDYDRQLTPRPHRVALLEGEHLRATVGLDLGGRLLSLRERSSDRELLYVNPVVQPANFALRNAWCSGGVEWNIGTRGHSPLTMEPLFAASVDGPDGEPMLRLWEWERLRGAVFQIDLSLPSATPMLLVRTRIRNLNDVPTPMYWWTNVAVAVTPETRIVAPAGRAFRTDYPNRMRVTDVPDGGDGDLTYPARHAHAADFFYDIAADRRPWIAAVNGDGSAVAHVSTSELRGRKLFVWGEGSGGRRWQEWLSHGGDEVYAEIQAGLAPTQFEHVMMPARAECSWTEAICPLRVDPRRTHRAEWGAAVEHIENAIEDVISVDAFEEWHQRGRAVADSPPRQLLAVGSGWGALERQRRTTTGCAWFDETATPFPDSSLGTEQELWCHLLRTGAVAAQSPDEPPRSYVTGTDWEARLAAAPSGWLTEYLHAVLAHGRGNAAAARELYLSSLRYQANAWAWRGLAELARTGGRPAEAAASAVHAARLVPGEWHLATEAVSRLLDNEQPHDALAVIDGLSPEIRARPRMRLLEGWAAHGAGAATRAEAVLLGKLEVPDLREGERSVDQLWNAVFPERPLPAHYDFRMVRAHRPDGQRPRRVASEE